MAKTRIHCSTVKPETIQRLEFRVSSDRFDSRFFLSETFFFFQTKLKKNVLCAYARPFLNFLPSPEVLVCPCSRLPCSRCPCSWLPSVTKQGGQREPQEGAIVSEGPCLVSDQWSGSCRKDSTVVGKSAFSA